MTDTLRAAALELCEAVLRLTRSDSCDTVTGCGCLRCQAFALRAALAAEPTLAVAVPLLLLILWIDREEGRCT